MKCESFNPLPIQPKDNSPKRKSLEVLPATPSLKVQLEKAQDQIATLELKLEVQKRELDEKGQVEKENLELKEKLIETKSELDKSLAARHQSVKVFGKEHEKRKLAQQELDGSVEESTEELVNQDQLLTKLRSENSKLKQTNQSLQKDLELTQKLAELRKVPYFESDLSYFKYLLYSVIAVGLVIVLVRRRND